MMMAFAIFADKDPDTDYGAGFYLFVIAFLLALTVTGLCIKFMIDYIKAKVHHGPVLERLRQYATEGGSEKANVYEGMPMIRSQANTNNVTIAFIEMEET
ncbi:hypothetical protein DPMN_079882 [Dreissena polymorpha]|uniref:Uncharacterized protein n=1 Tax=Dreissena polymorpha TaxID=45954 RepID=A0A9D4BRI5_DREPO|nr:hypothetical protein DPMN_079882 [Dreissena polymorpha]